MVDLITKKGNYMKTGRLKNMMIITSVALCTLFAFSSCDKDDDDDNNAASFAVSGNASGTQVVPSVAGGGSGTITGTYNPNNRMLTYTSTWAGLTGAPSSAGFYTGASGANGTTVGTPWSLGAGLTGTGTFSGSMTLTEAEAVQLTSGGWYYTYATTANPSGEVRGQITAVQ